MAHPVTAPPAGALRFPHAEPPPYGTPIPVAPGILWLRLALPYALDHVNLYLLEEKGGWAVFDTGISDEASRAAWEQVFAQTFGGKPVTRLLVSHYHPDHAGLAGWLDERFGAPLLMSQTEYLMSRFLQMDRAEKSQQGDADPTAIAFYRANGLDPATIAQVATRGHSYLKRTTGLKPIFTRLTSGDTLDLGGREWLVLTGGGHALEQVMLWCKADRLFLSADQVLARISPNVSVVPFEPDGNPLGLYLASLAQIRDTVPDDVLVLPCHNLPFEGLHLRVEDLEAHHLHRCDLIAAAASRAPVTCADIIPVIFRRALTDPHQMSFAIGEALAHLNYMQRIGALLPETGADGAVRYRTP
jgi:glyoxylase-like metal-dependent hydrolase (beta-lactamase superfamily II)